MAKYKDPETCKPSNQTSSLTINVEHLLECQSVEKQRIEFKRSWNNGPTKIQVTKTISAFANDFYNDNGGYIVIGVEEDDDEDAMGQIKLPPVGIKPSELDRIQKQIMGACKSNISPAYYPVLSPELVDDKHVLVIWAQASDNRPHRARESDKGKHHFFIRKGVQTTKATDEEIKKLLEDARKVPFDDRMARHESGRIIDATAVDKKLVKKFLDDIRSNLDKKVDRNLLEKLNLVARYGDEVVDHTLLPKLTLKNVALLMFNMAPDYYFPGALIEVAQLSRDKEVLDVRELKGPLDRQIKDCIDLVLSTTTKERSIGSLTYPKRALREAIVNAVYHRGYEPEHNSPIKINIRPHCLEIISYPGPHQSLKEEHFMKGKDIPQVPARNRRIGEFLKDLKLAEARGTGVNTIFKSMMKNTNPEPKFKFDSTYFQVILPAHPKFQAVMLMKDIEELEAKGEKYQAGEVLQEAFDKDPSIISQNLIQKLISLHDGCRDHPNVQRYRRYVSAATKKRCELLNQLNEWLHGNPRGYISRGVYLIKELVKVNADATDFAEVTEFAYDLSNERNGDTRKPILASNQLAHQLLEAYGQEILSRNITIAWYFVCVKYNIYTMSKEKFRRGSRERNASKAIIPYLTDAKEYLENAIVVSEREASPSFVATQYRQLGYILYHLFVERKATASAVQECYDKARKLHPKLHINTTLIPPKVR